MDEFTGTIDVKPMGHDQCEVLIDGRRVAYCVTHFGGRLNFIKHVTPAECVAVGEAVDVWQRAAEIRTRTPVSPPKASGKAPGDGKGK